MKRTRLGTVALKKTLCLQVPHVTFKRQVYSRSVLTVIALGKGWDGAVEVAHSFTGVFPVTRQQLPFILVHSLRETANKTENENRTLSLDFM